jgi:N-acetylglucosamine kinase-like BadF-type ATPase
MIGKLYLGVDGGQSSTKALVGNARGEILGRGLGGPCNHASLGEGRAKLERALAEAVGQALVPLGLTLDEARFHRVCVGMSGGPDDKREIIKGLIQADSYDVTTDAHIALYGALEGGVGAVVISGTGSIALSRDGQGRIWRAGGWGYVFGDEGSAFDIARLSLRASLAAEEEWGPSTALRAALLTATESKNANQLLHRWYAGEFSRDQTADWSRLAEKAAAQEDAVAQSILEGAGNRLAQLAATVAGMASLPAGSAKICPIGGVFANRSVMQSFSRALDVLLGVRPTAASASPANGALQAATAGILLSRS